MRRNKQARVLMWRLMQNFGEFRTDWVSQAAHVPSMTVLSYVSDLMRSGYVECFRPHVGKRAACYRVIRTSLVTPCYRGISDRQRVWSAMRGLQQFTLPQLMAVAEATEGNVQVYVRALVATGFVELHSFRDLGLVSRFNRYRMSRDTGEQCPVVRRDGCVFDVNTGVVHEPKTDPGIAGLSEGDSLGSGLGDGIEAQDCDEAFAPRGAPRACCAAWSGISTYGGSSEETIG